MKQQLKNFIQQNRTGFDDANPPEGIWENIAAALNTQQPGHSPVVRKSWTPYIVRIAAAILLLTAGGIAIYNYGRQQAYDDYSRINPELAAEQQTYARLVIQKRDSIAHFAASNPALYGEFSDVLSQMESSYNALKQELDNSPNKELTLEAMIRNLQVQIEVLSQQMRIMDYVKKETKNDTKNEQI